MQTLGQILVAFSLLVATLTACLSLGGSIRSRPLWVKASGQAVSALAWLSLAISLILVHTLLTHDFSNRYAASYSDTSMPFFYLVTAFWAGEKGALLFWVFGLSILFAILSKSYPDKDGPFFGAVQAVVALALLFFDILMVFASNPFETFLTSQGPPDGSGMNPLLQNPLMALHPPFQLAGFVAYTIPFAFSLGALITGRRDEGWIKESRPYNLLAWSLLSAGLVIGGLWAYLELGWGGFWGWDPVENAALLPWLTGTAYLHTSSLTLRRRMLHRLSHFLIALTFFLTIFATFLTRSQLIASLHAFSNSALAPFFVYYLILVAVVSLGLLFFRRKQIASPRPIEGLLSREAMVVMNNIFFLLLAFVVLWGTLLPKISESKDFQHILGSVAAFLNRYIGTNLRAPDGPITVGPDWFNKVSAPIGLVILALTALGPLLPYRSHDRKAVRKAFWRTFLVSLVATIVSTFGFVLVGATILTPRPTLLEGLRAFALSRSPNDLLVFLTIFFAMWVLAVATHDIIRAAKNRAQVIGQGLALRTFGKAFMALFQSNPRRFGGHLVHIGVAFCFLAFAGSAEKIERKDVVLSPGERLTVGGYDLIFLGMRERSSPKGDFASSIADVLVVKHGAEAPKDLAEALASIEGVTEVTIEDPPLISLRFQDPSALRKAQIFAFAAFSLPRDFEVVRISERERSVELAHIDPWTLNVVPRSFHRLTTILKDFVRAVGEDFLAIRMTPGDPLLVLQFRDEDLFSTFLKARRNEQRQFDAAQVFFDKDRILILPKGMGEVMAPEVRFYPKFENPTTEVDIRPTLLYDLYLAVSPAVGTQSVSLTVMVNPLVFWLWIGAFIAVVGGFALALLATTRTVQVAEAAEGALITSKKA